MHLSGVPHDVAPTSITVSLLVGQWEIGPASAALGAVKGGSDVTTSPCLRRKGPLPATISPNGGRALRTWSYSAPSLMIALIQFRCHLSQRLNGETASSLKTYCSLEL